MGRLVRSAASALSLAVGLAAASVGVSDEPGLAASLPRAIVPRASVPRARIYVVPADALPYLGRGLSASLFDLGSLLRDQAGGRFPVEVRYAGRVPSLPGLTITSAGRGTARGYLTTETLTNAYQTSS